LRADGQAFARRYPKLRAQLKSLFGAWKQAGKRVAVFGAGHLAAKFVNLFGLEKLVECVIDDNPHKQNLLMRVRVWPSRVPRRWRPSTCACCL
jgi:hypothetical protein